jgi:hypothetical protein
MDHSRKFTRLCDPCEQLLLFAMAKLCFDKHDMSPIFRDDRLSAEASSRSLVSHVANDSCRLCHLLARNRISQGCTPVLLNLYREEDDSEITKLCKIVVCDGRCSVELVETTLNQEASMVLYSSTSLTLVSQPPGRASVLISTFCAVMPSHRTPHKFLEDLLSEPRMHVGRAKRWLDACDAKHQKCKVCQDVDLPTRILRLDVSTRMVHLTSGAGIRGKYAALSYCWGGHNPIVTTKQNLQEQENGLEMSLLPPLFRDVIDVVLSLDVTYLWIDALCIVQDDLQEWAQEAARMADVFSNAYITIAATDATNPMQHILKRNACIGLSTLDQSGTIYFERIQKSRSESSGIRILTAPLNRRAWYVLQIANGSGEVP